MSKTVRTTALLAGLALLALTLTGCQAIAQKAVEKGTGVKVDKGGNSVTVTGKDGQQASFSSEPGKLPEGLPADFPVYTGKIEGSAKTDAAEGTSFSFTVVTPDQVSQVADFYKTKLAAAGWTIKNVVAGTQGEEESAIVMAEKQAEKSTAQVAVTKRNGEDTKALVILVVKK